mmetsp:Transcript_23847/g.94576  ORF Transcript_23847/g.94576 Transcript_23847/m.94576 type:complete len:392 (-) Transcript_23847:569-1744(-)
MGSPLAHGYFLPLTSTPHRPSKSPRNGMRSVRRLLSRSERMGVFTPGGSRPMMQLRGMGVRLGYAKPSRARLVWRNRFVAMPSGSQRRSGICDHTWPSDGSDGSSATLSFLGPGNLGSCGRPCMRSLRASMMASACARTASAYAGSGASGDSVSIEPPGASGCSRGVADDAAAEAPPRVGDDGEDGGVPAGLFAAPDDDPAFGSPRSPDDSVREPADGSEAPDAESERAQPRTPVDDGGGAVDCSAATSAAMASGSPGSVLARRSEMTAVPSSSSSSSASESGGQGSPRASAAARSARMSPIMRTRLRRRRTRSAGSASSMGTASPSSGPMSAQLCFDSRGSGHGSSPSLRGRMKVRSHATGWPQSGSPASGSYSSSSYSSTRSSSALTTS